VDNLKTKFILLMGVSGSGKTTIGREVATKLGWSFYDADNFHTSRNISKMRMGIPLNDEDRIPWLRRLHKLIVSCLNESKPGVLACSALKERYRQILVPDGQEVLLVYLKGSYELIWSRMINRHNHYMKSEMLKSQFGALEEPTEGMIIDINQSVEEIVATILEHVYRSAID
jgi:gluconokinase